MDTNNNQNSTNYREIDPIHNNLVNAESQNETECILSLSYEKQHLACAFYKINSGELFASYETIDLPPHYSYLQNLLRLLNPECCLASGLYDFQKFLMKLLKFNDDEEPHDYRVTKKANLLKNLDLDKSKVKFLSFTQDVKQLHKNYQLIINTKFSGSVYIDKKFNEQYLQSYLPLEQDLVVHSLGNLLQYLSSNVKHLLLQLEPVSTDNGCETSSKLILNDIEVFYLQSHVAITENTVNSLGISSQNSRSPVGLSRNNAKTESVFYDTQQTMTIHQLLKKYCCSKFGCKLLQQQLQQPIRNINELKLHYNTIDFILLKLNLYKIKKLHQILKHIDDLAVIFKLIEVKPNLSGHKWFQLKRTLVNLLCLITLCNELVADGDEGSAKEKCSDTIFHLIGMDSQSKTKLIRNGLITLDVVLDINEIIQQKQFVCKQNFDVDLDKKRSKMVEIQDSIRDAFFRETKNIPSYLTNIEGYYIPEIGYVLQIKFNNVEFLDLDKSVTDLLAELENDSLKFLCNSGESYFFKTSLCNKLNEEFGQIYYDILEHEQRICTRLIKYLRGILSELLGLIKLAGKLDMVLAMATFSKEYKLTRPQIHFENKIEIIDGWHLLSALLNNKSRTKFIRNSTKISLETSNLITILQAPNSSGKSIYMKQIGLIFYLAHCGCFVPAKEAKIFLLDSILTCLYRNESVHNGSSSFLLDLQQISRIAMCSKTERNLILIDEFGSGTVSEDGQALLCGVIEEFLRLGSNLKSVVLIATHFLDISKFINKKCSNQTENNEERNIVARSAGKVTNVDCSNICLKNILSYQTFENVQIQNSNSAYLISTYKLIDGYCEHMKYAKKIFNIKSIINNLFNVKERKPINIKQKSTEQIGENLKDMRRPQNELHENSRLGSNPNKKIEFTYKLIKLFCNKQPVNEESIQIARPEELKNPNFNQILNKIKLKFFQNKC